VVVVHPRISLRSCGLLAVTEELGIPAKPLCDGGPTMLAELMDELREVHLGLKPKRRTGQA